MKPEFDKEIDSLLRARARRAPSRTGGTGDPATPDRAHDGRVSARDAARAEHMDADELSAFAERALPAAALSRYAAHLADCDGCRRAATALALAANVAVGEREAARAEGERGAARAPVARRGGNAAQVTAAGWRERLAAFFAPRSWRYAMPVLALLCVGVVALVVMRRVPQGELELARRNAAPQASEAGEPSAQNHAAGAAGSATKTDAPEASQSQGNEALTRSDANATRAAGTTGSANVATSAAANEVARREVSEERQLDKVQSESQVGGAVAGVPGASAPVQQQRAQEPAPKSVNAPAAPATMPMISPPPPTPAPTPVPEAVGVARDEDEVVAPKDARTAKKAEAARAQSQTKARSAQRKGDESAANATSAAGRTALSASESSAAAPNANGAGGASRRSRANESDDAKAKRGRDDYPTETRTVGGRRFRRDGGAWVDAAYTGQAATVVRRGSEQYRALVADEPEIGRIASSFSGEVVVVWKGRAYRIK